MGRTYATDKRQRLAMQRFLDEIKLSVGCYVCGYKSSIYAMDFDHINPEEKLLDISSCKSWAKLERELPKCDVICKNCHVEKSVSEGSYWATRTAVAEPTKNGHPGPVPTERLENIRDGWIDRRRSRRMLWNAQ